nr:PREDICTED: odorant receptor 85b-like [Tribolium castaneum]|eukprot:XP_015839871.1 PREDICTED: odorant receptor 85b-like [Tribolium castaneum]
MVFSQFVSSSLVLCFTCWNVSILQPFSFEWFQSLGYFLILLVQLYFYCYYGTNLSEECDKITTSVYMGKWYKYDVKSRKALILLMERSKKPTIVSAGKILDLSVETFTTILRRSYSLLALLKNQN